MWVVVQLLHVGFEHVTMQSAPWQTHYCGVIGLNFSFAPVALTSRPLHSQSDLRPQKHRWVVHVSALGSLAVSVRAMELASLVHNGEAL